MSTKSFLFTLALLVAVVLTATFPAAGQAQQGTGGNFVLVNYIGQQVHLDLDDAKQVAYDWLFGNESIY